MNQQRRNEIIDKALEYQQTLKEATRDMTNEERVLFLEAVIRGATAAKQIFERGDPNEK